MATLFTITPTTNQNTSYSDLLKDDFQKKIGCFFVFATVLGIFTHRREANFIIYADHCPCNEHIKLNV
ncbi:MAG: hypothetical protein NWS74_10135 [Salibacteraceae bacterium]|nr:hypothetical protein [Salibacteraceae bacterium]MDP4686698.1 hypothetical protein [Salibacteraceae bacterium]MDP4763553.1 hypothetical protein [Salibacteraceae bacterium]MDP4844322.1 hypothetical protein [Salibacteraceae bacterium]